MKLIQTELLLSAFSTSVLQEGQSSQGVDPVHIWSKHSLPITDLYCTAGGMMARIVSASQDQTCKV